jgi:hypothetical protein
VVRRSWLTKVTEIFHRRSPALFIKEKDNVRKENEELRSRKFPSQWTMDQNQYEERLLKIWENLTLVTKLFSVN